MSAHVEWVDARTSHVELVGTTDTMPDGQSVDRGKIGLAISSDDVIVIEGSPAHIRAILTNALLQLDRHDRPASPEATR